MADDDCARREPEISALLDGELAGPEAAAVEVHLRACPACSVLARDLAAVGRALRSWDAEEETPPVSAGFRARLLDRLGADRRSVDRRDSALPPRAPAPARLRLLPAAAAAAAVMAVGGLGWLLDPGPSPAPPGDSSPGPFAVRGREPADPDVRAAFDRLFPTDAASIPAPAAAAAAPAPPGAGSHREPDESPGTPPSGSLWAGPWRFHAPGAFDDFLRYRERARESELALAAREAAHAESTTVAAIRPETAPAHALTAFTASLDVGAPLGGDGSAANPGITVWPLRFRGGAPKGPVSAPLDLPSALAGRASERPVLRESPGRSASTVLVSNPHPTRPLLLLAGEVLDGGGADRVVARDALVPARARDLPVAVAAVEAGRESAHPFGTRFRAVAGVGGPRLRGLAMAQAAPGEIVEFLRGRLDILGVTALRRSLADAYSDRGPASPTLRALRPRVEDLLRGLRDPDTVGFAVAHGGELLAVEVFGSHALLERDAGRVLEGCALEAATYREGAAPPGREAVVALLDAASRGRAFDGGAGSVEVGVLSPEGGLLGSGIAVDGALLHAALVRGAGAGALAGRGPRSGDFPGGAPPTAPGGESGEGPSGPDGGGSGGDEPSGPPDTTGGGDDSKPKEPDTPERPR